MPQSLTIVKILKEAALIPHISRSALKYLDPLNAS